MKKNQIVMENAMNNKSYKIILFSSLGILFNLTNLSAQSSEASSNYNVMNSTYYEYIILFLFITFVLIFVALHYYGFGEGKPEKPKEKFPFLAILKQVVTRSAPLELEHEILLPDDFDGIKELDNQVPPWFNWLFYGSIIFAILYLLNYHVFSADKLQVNEYNDEVKFASVQRDELIKSGAFVNETTVTQLTDAASIEAGKEIFNNNCVACHGPQGGGLVGPNLTDDYWIHGGGIKNIFKTIKYGVPAKGMITWQTQLNPKQIQSVASYVMSLHGTNPQNAKPPQGDRYTESDSSNTIKKK
jgi:cytochrome c oxidase cbb3-type subunit III